MIDEGGILEKGRAFKDKIKLIKPELLAKMNAWSIENMAAHGAGNRSIEYIGSKIEGHIVRDYYKDDSGDFWYKNRAILPTGEIVSMDMYILGHEVKPRRTFKIK